MSIPDPAHALPENDDAAVPELSDRAQTPPHQAAQRGPDPRGSALVAHPDSAAIASVPTQPSGVEDERHGAPDAYRMVAPTHDLPATVMAPVAALSGVDGQIRAGGMQGLFASDTRVLTTALLRFGETEPQSLVYVVERPGTTRFVAVAPGFGDRIADPTVRVERVRTVTPTGMSEEVHVQSTASVPVHTTVSIDLECDLTPLVLARNNLSRPAVAARPSGPDGLVWSQEYVAVTARAENGAASTEPARLQWSVDLAARGSVTLRWSVRVDERRPILVGAATPVEWSRPTVACDDPRLVRLLWQSLDDLESLRLVDPDHPGDTFVAAGVPWFLTLFGRDSIWAARMLLPLGTRLAAGTLWTLARRQGSRLDSVSGEAPGKIMHELRSDDVLPDHVDTLPPAYYGTVDATVLWINLLADAWRWGLPDDTVAALMPHLCRALSWLDDHGDPDGDGFIEYVDHSGRGLANQGWKDSGDAVRFHDGRIAQPPIALCEVQGYAHRAALDAAILLDAFGDRASRGQEAARWRQYAANLAARFRQRFWVDGPLGPYPAMALDRDGRPVDSLTSNISHLLGTGLLSPDEERIVAGLLAAPALAGGYGLRSTSTIDRGFAPLSYHHGSVWPHDTAIAVLGLVTVGAHEAATELICGLLGAAEAFDYRLPELLGGDDRAAIGRPVPHPAACRPQAWAAAAAVTIVQAVLGLSADVPGRRLTVRPLTGQPLGGLAVRGLQVAGQPFDVSVGRQGRVEVSGQPRWLRVERRS